MKKEKQNILVTGAGGYLGSETIKTLVKNRDLFNAVVALDLREIPVTERSSQTEYVTGDIRESLMEDYFCKYEIDIVIHLAAVIPGKNSNRELEYSIDVLGTKNILKACLASGVKKIIYSSSGAAYGYHADNPEWLSEKAQIRGNDEFPYSCHKRLVEEMMSEYRENHPQLKQLIFRPGVVLGDNTANPITSLFAKAFVLGIAGASSPFVFIWDRDVVACIIEGVLENKTGIFNLAGDGCLTMKEISKVLRKPYLPLPSGLVKAALGLLKKIGISQYGPEQVKFLQYRPVLSNKKLKEEFGYIPKKTSEEVFSYFISKNPDLKAGG